ncbi:hypothetical protein M501DRAFT_993210 [Patellaria atrata CBS 101060]|uniref:Pentatricopeptide repeat-containing protein n=1 Tax=Patellaria atrata CBS 101060 TaxID=1346257 RepID=A0A9P4SAV0_9PEZI|nr:hypothetical protein M501DRAFT_993210 [Patellaria atrata CBS 101060]
MDEVTFRTEINHAVAKGDPGRLLRALRSVQDHVSYIQSLPSNKFITILKLLGSTLLFKDIRDIHLKYRPGPGRCYGAVDGTTLADISEQQVVPFYRLVNIRLAAGAGLPVGVYKPILHYTAIMGEGELAKKISREMAARNVKRDLECFNHSLSALVWNKYGHYRRSVRIAPRHLAAHDPSQLNCVSFTRMYTIGYGGIKEEALEIHRDMASHGISPDKESYYFLMIAMAREADLPGVKDILTRVWGIDVDAIMDGISVDEHFVSSINPTSPVYPDEELLRIVAHCFGINNDVPTALRIVDSISRRYSLPISLNTWEELFRWTYALSRRKLPKGVNGRLPFRSPERLFRTMQAEPYNIQPTFWMYTLLFRNAYRLEDPAKLMGYFEEAIKVFQEKIWKENNKAMAAIEKARAEVRRGIVPATPILILERRQDALGLERRYAEHEMREWFKLFLSLGDNRSQKKVWLRGVGFSWEREMVPNLVRTFERFAPARIAYETTGGWLYFTLRGNEEIVSQLERKVKIEAEKYMKMTGTHFEDAYSRNRNPKKIGSRVTNALGI